jgi:hypothetical protein
MEKQRESKNPTQVSAQLKAEGGASMAPPSFNLQANPIQAKMPEGKSAGNAPAQMRGNGLTGGEAHIYGLRTQINAAARAQGVDASLVAAILLDEYNRRGFEDSVQDTEAAFIIAYEGWLEDAEVGMWEATMGDLATTSFGDSQMTLNVAEELVNRGYVDEPADWDSDHLDSSLKLVTDSNMAPTLVAARVHQTIDHWQNGGVDISTNYAVLGTLYSMGLTGRSGINPNPQPNARGTQINGYRTRMAQILAMP